MPHAELKFSSDLTFDTAAMLQDIETVVQAADPGAGACKGRGYPAEVYHHTHCLLNLMMLTKPHRDAAFTKALLADLEATMRRHLTQKCFVSLGIDYATDAYVTTQHDPQN